MRIAYVLSLVFGILAILGFLTFGESKFSHQKASASSLGIAKESETSQAGTVEKNLRKENLEKSNESIFSENLKNPITKLILQIGIILLVSRIFGFLATKWKQPSAIGEIVAGILIGPTLLGHFFPELYGFLFAKETLGVLKSLSQIGLILFLFIVGMELDLSILKEKVVHSLFISHMSILIPFIIGILISLFLFEEFGKAQVEFIPFALFLGISLSITAFPVLARILQEKNLTKTTLGTLAITCAALDDVTAWSLLALVIAIVKLQTISDVLYILVFTLVFIFVMLFVVRNLLEKFFANISNEEGISKSVVASFLFILLASAFFTEWIGIHALFGAFIAGLIVPNKNVLKKTLTEKLEDVSLLIFLPIFFAFTGLRTDFSFLLETQNFFYFLIVLAAAILGKLGGGAISAKIAGESWKDSIALGILMNTRGLIEIVVLNIGYELGVLGKEIFAILVLMALITTAMTGTCLELLDRVFAIKRARKDKDTQFKILFSFGPLKMGRTLYTLSKLFKSEKQDSISALHMTPNSDLSKSVRDHYEEMAFKELLRESRLDGTKLRTVYRSSYDVQGSIANEVEKAEIDLLLLGSGKSFFTEDILTPFIKEIIEKVDCDVGIFLEKDFEIPKGILYISYSDEEDPIFTYLEKLLKKDITLYVLEKNNAPGRENKLLHGLKPYSQQVVSLDENACPVTSWKHYGLCITSITTWIRLSAEVNELYESVPSTLVLRVKPH